MTLNEIVALASVLVSIGANVALYIHLSSGVAGRFSEVISIMNSRFDSVDRRFDTMLGKVIEIDNRLTRVEERMGIRP